MADVKELLIELKLQNDQLVRAVEETNKKIGGLDKKQSKLKKGLTGLRLGYIAIAGVLTGVLARGLNFFVKKASDAQETLSKFNTVFKSMQKEANAVAKNLSRNFGLSALAARKLLGDTGDLLTGFGFTEKASLDLSKQVNELAVDLASFTNFSGGAEGASAALTKALLGERESVKSLGISILETDVKAQVLKNTQAGLTFETNRQAKAYATLMIAQTQSKNAQGDFARTSNQFANQVRIAKANIEDWAVSIGQKLLPVFAPFLRLLNNVLKPSRDLDDVTRDLIRNQTTHREVVEKLSKARKEGNKHLVIELENMKRLTENNVVQLIAEMNEQYEKEAKNVKLVTIVSEKLTDAKITLNAKIHDQTKEWIDLTFYEAKLLGLHQDTDAMSGTLINGTIKRTKAEEKLLKIRSTAGQAESKAITTSAEYTNKIRGLAKALTDNKDKTLILSEAREGLRKDIEEQMRLIPALEAAEKKAADAKEARKKDSKDRQDAELAQTKEINKLIKEGEEEDEDEALQRKLDRIDMFMDKFKISKEQEVGLTKASAAIQEKIDDDRLKRRVEATKVALGDISSLTSSTNSTLFAIGKASSLAQAIINNAQAITKTMAAVPFPFNLPLAAGQAAAGAVQVSKIVSQQPPKGFRSGKAGLEPSDMTPRGEDGIIGARIGESILNVNATAELGSESINALNAGAGGGTPKLVMITVDNKDEGIEVMNNYLKRYGTSEQGVSL